MDSTLFSFLRSGNFAEQVTSFGLKLLGAIIVLVIGVMAIRLISSILGKALKRAVHDATVRSYILNTARILLWLILILILLAMVGIQTTSIVAILGAAGLAIGLALQGSLSNFAAGIMLLLFRPFKSGDEIEVAGVIGLVVEISIFTTIIDMPDGIRAFVPNSIVFSGVIKNRTILAFRRSEVKIKVNPESDMEKVHAILFNLLARDERIFDPPRSHVKIVEETSAAVTLSVRPATKIEDEERVRMTLLQEIRRELAAEGIVIVADIPPVPAAPPPLPPPAV